MKRVLFIIVILFSSCKTKYYGYIYDLNNKKPIEKVEIYDWYSEKTFHTDEKGFFMIEKTEIRDLILRKEGYNTDTIPLVSAQNGEFIKKKFKGDTLYLIPLK